MATAGAGASMALLAPPAEASSIDGKGISNADVLAGFADLHNLPMTFQDGSPFTLAQFRGRALIVNFWAYWCVNCIAEFPSLQELQKAAGGPDQLAVVLVSSPQDWQTDQSAASQRGLPFMLARYNTPETADESTTQADILFGNVVDGAPKFALPVNYIISRSGHLVLAGSGSVQWLSQQILGRTAVALHS